MKYFDEILIQQKNELNESIIYEKLSNLSKDKENKEILKKIAIDEKKHFAIWREITKTEVKPNKLKIFFYVNLARILWLSFTLKLMETGEEDAQKFYSKVEKEYPIAKKIWEDEKAHELSLIRILKDVRLKYAWAIVLGLNDALVELTWTLAWLTLAFNNAKVIWVTWLIMWIAASMSMAASGYLSSREEETEDSNPIKSAIYTWIAYIITVIILVSPYFVFSWVFTSLFVMLIFTIIIIASYNFYISIAKEVSFLKRFLEMALISLWVAFISFWIWYFVNTFFWLDL